MTNCPTRRDSDEFAAVVDWYTDMLHRGTPPTIQSVCKQFPAYADELREMLPVVRDLVDENGSTTKEIGPYRLGQRIGGGGIGTVYAATDTRNGYVVAIKIISRRNVSEHQLARFRHEARLIQQLPAGPFVDVLDAGQTETHQYLVMRLIDGCNLHQHVEQQGVLSVDETLRIGIEIADGLAIAHAAGIVHRDIKPSNLMRDSEGRIQIVDFGLAFIAEGIVETVPINMQSRSGGDVAEDTSSVHVLRTAAGTVLGTMAYMAPEQTLHSRDADHRSDIYSLGCTLFHCLTGHPPHSELTWVECLIARREKPPPSTRTSRPDVPKELDRILRRCMARRPRDRFPTMAALSTALSTALGKVNSTSNNGARSFPIKATGIAAAVCLMALGLTVLPWQIGAGVLWRQTVNEPGLFANGTGAKARQFVESQQEVPRFFVPNPAANIEPSGPPVIRVLLIGTTFATYFSPTMTNS